MLGEDSPCGEAKLIINVTVAAAKVLYSSASTSYGMDCVMPAPVTAGILLMTLSIPQKCHRMPVAIGNWKTAEPTQETPLSGTKAQCRDGKLESSTARVLCFNSAS